MATIGSRIRDRRQKIGLSVDDLAALLGKNRATVYRYESDEIENFPIAVIGPLAEALQTTPAYLMGWEDEEKPATETGDGLSEQETQLMDLVRKLTPEQKKLLLAWMQTMRGQGE